MFVMFKPGLIYGADVITVFGHVWAGLMLVSAGGNLIVAVRFGPAVWATFITMFPLGSKVVLAGVQYGVTRKIVRRRMRASRVAAAGGG